MELLKLDEELVQAIIPQKIWEIKLLTDDAKRLLATLMYHWDKFEDVKTSGCLTIGNLDLYKGLGWAKNSRSNRRLLNAVALLEIYKLVKRIPGEKWKKGKDKKASEYYVNWDIIN